MRKVIRLTGCCLTLMMGLAAAADAAQASVCINIDETRDTLSPQDRAAAILLVTRQFELAGEPVVQGDCSTRYTLSHVMLGNTITVTLSGPNTSREGTALGLDDLPALYSQMVRSIVTGRPMTGMGVVDRTNVTASQTSSRRVGSDRFGYARVGYSGIFSDRTYGAPAVGLGYRAELDSFGIDVSFLNSQISSSSGYNSAGASAGSLLKLEVLHFTNPSGNTTKYFGGGVGWGWTNIESGGLNRRYGNGSGLEGDLTAGYEIARATTVRLFAQLDAALPFYKVISNTYSRSGVVTTSRYAPSLVFSVGLGWQRGRH
jgi:hypothetical protein